MNKKNANSKNAFVTIVGRANAGKSSLLNALVQKRKTDCQIRRDE